MGRLDDPGDRLLDGVVDLERGRGPVPHRWQIELLFKLWKSHNRRANHAESQSVAWRMAEFWAKLIGVILQHWLLLTMTWLDFRRS